MASLAQPPNIVDTVRDALAQHRHEESEQEIATAHGHDEHPQTPPIPSTSQAVNFSQRAPSERKGSSSGYRTFAPPGTPSARTGPPRSISARYSLSSAQVESVSTEDREGQSPTDETFSEDPDHASQFVPTTSPFRGALEYAVQKEREKDRAAKKSRANSYFYETWNPKKWLADSPNEEQPDSKEQKDGPGAEPIEDKNADVHAANLIRNTVEQESPHTLPRHSSLPHMNAQSKSNVPPKWGRLRSLLPYIAGSKSSGSGPSTIVPHSVNITDELISGGLSTVMLHLWFERDEKDHRRVPVLFHRLRIRVSDSLHPLHGHKAVFRIECEYANGAVRWVVYRQLREFLSLHTHYALSNAYNRNVENLPEFPKTSLPYFKFLKERGKDVGKADFARLQRASLENYLIGLMRAVMFHPAANRLAGFLELSALSIALAQSGGAQYKAGILRIDAVGSKANFGRRGTPWREKKTSKWCSVRESYLVVHDEMGELAVWDVFLIDSDFKIERPTRYYRQGLNVFHQFEDDEEEDKTTHAKGKSEPDAQSHNARSTVGSLTSHLSKAFHFGHQRHSSDVPRSQNGHAATSSRPRNSTVSAQSTTPSSPIPSSRPLTPMLDPSTNTNPLLGSDGANGLPHGEAGESERRKRRRRQQEVSKHTFYIENSQMRLKLFARNERQMLQWIAAFERVARESHYTGKNRFDSFAPIRLNVAAQWLVDGRDYFWNLSRAILLAKESIHIHDWWLSPELQMRRPNKPKYRLDRLLERKAKEGVKIYIILYQEVSNRTTPTDSNYTKQRLTALHPNIMVQRSPSHFQTGTFYWAHHEKLCVIDQAIAFMGGLDACFGRWDTPQHVLVDDPEVGSEGEQIWPGKDYSNPRIQDFHTLTKPFDDMYDRTKISRMPWHDVSMQVVGQPARDLARHFVQRWNYLLRIKNHSRQMPFLLPPPEFKPGELQQMGLTGTCELQICRSAGPWSMGTPDRVEFSIQNAYLKSIQMSEHFVYIENQFFITSTVVNEVKVENKIGDALVHRIVRAHRERTPWKCCIVIPLIPGFAFPVDHSDASAIRIIMECQNRTICRGPNSIFARLRKEGIDPDEYITVFSLRNWAKLRGDVLTTEQVYIHGKVCIVDDRLAIIGSANINERSQRGDRDSEIAAVIRDTDMIDCTMAGKPYKAGRFAHTLRVRLMREHIGVDVDAMYEDDLMASEPVKPAYEQEEWDPDDQQQYGKEHGVTHIAKGQRRNAAGSLWHDTLDGIEQAMHGTGDAGSRDIAMVIRKAGVKSKGLDATAGDTTLREERMMYTRDGQKEPGFPSAVVPTIEEKTILENRPPAQQADGSPINVELQRENGVTSQWVHPDSADPANHEYLSQNGSAALTEEPEEARVGNGELYGAPAHASPDPQHDDQPPHARLGKNDADEEEEKAVGARATLRKHLSAKLGSRPWTLPTPTPQVDPHGFEDPICDAFWKNVWLACAVHNTEIYRKVFHAVPDDLVTTWKQYKEFIVHHERLNKPVKEHDTAEPLARMPSEAGDADAPGQPHTAQNMVHIEDEIAGKGKEQPDDAADSTGTRSTPPLDEKTRKTRAARGPEPFDQADREEMERLLHELRGHLVLYPTRFLEGEDAANNFLFNADRLMPLPIYD